MTWRIVALAGGVLALAAAGLVFTIGGRSAPRQPEQPVAGAQSPSAPKPFLVMSPEAPPAPAEPFADGAGAPVTFAAFAGKAVLVNLWATWCAPCVNELPMLARLHAQKGGKEFAVIALNLDRPGKADVPAFLNQHDAGALEAYADPSMKLMRAFGVAGLPTTILIGADGREIARREGEAAWDSPEAWAAIQDALAGAD